MSKNQKSYNQVMNEWAAQRSFLHRAGSGLIRPGYGVTGGARVWGWIWRIFVFVLVPLLLYLGALRFYGKSAGFSADILAQIKRFLHTEDATIGAVRWDFNGELRIGSLKVKSTAENCFNEVKVETLSTWISMPQVFKPDWHLKSVDSFKAFVSLRPGAPAKTAASTETRAPLLTAGWGISPDFSRLSVDRYTSQSLTLTWGGNPSTSGDLSGSAASLTRQGEGWNFVAAGGTFRQGWLDQIGVTGVKVRIDSDRAVIERGDFTVPGGGSGSITGSVTIGEVPEVDATIKLENTPFHPFLPEFFRPYVEAKCDGTVKLSGSTNRSTGILMDSAFTIRSGTVSRVPVFRALELATGETHVAQPSITAGHIHFTSQGTQDTGGLLIEANDVFLDCGTNLKIALTIRHERKENQASNAREAIRAIDHPAEVLSLTTTGTLRIGLSPETVAKLKPAIRQEFFTREDQGMVWMEVPYRMEDGEFTRETADRIIALHNSGK